MVMVMVMVVLRVGGIGGGAGQVEGLEHVKDLALGVLTPRRLLLLCSGMPLLWRLLLLLLVLLGGLHLLL